MRMGFLSTTVPRITDARAKDTLKRDGQCPTGGRPFGKGEACVLPMPLLVPFQIDLFHQFCCIAWNRLFKGPRGGFHSIGKRKDGGFGGLRDRTGIAERGFFHLGDILVPESQDFPPGPRIFFLLKGALVKVPDEAAPMMFPNGFPNPTGESVFTGKDDTILYVGEDD
jgi:hypothetical protein